MKIEINCENCGKLTLKELRYYKRSQHHYCSKRCSNLHKPRRKPEGKCFDCNEPVPTVRKRCDKCAKTNSKTKYWNTRYQNFKQLLQKYKLSSGCKDCGYNKHHAGLEFDHLPNHTKLANVSALYGKSKDKIMKEISKCDVVCGTCHNIRTYKRRNCIK